MEPPTNPPPQGFPPPGAPSPLPPPYVPGPGAFAPPGYPPSYPQAPGPYAPPPYPPGPHAPGQYLPPPPQSYGPAPAVPLGGYPQGSPPVFTARVITVTSRQRVAAIVAVLGAALVAVGTFLPWLQADVEGLGIRNGNGWTNLFGETSWGPLLGVLALAIAGGVAPTIVRVASPAAVYAAVAAAVLAVVGGAYQFTRVTAERPAIEASTSSGIYVMLAGSVIALVAAVVTSRPGQPAKVSAPRAVGAVG